MAINEDLADAAIADRLELLRFEAGIVARVVRAYEGALADLVADLEVARAAYDRGDIAIATLERIEARTDGLRAALAGVYRDSRAILAEGMEAAARVEVASTLESAAAAIPPEVDLTFDAPPMGDILTAINQPIGGRRWADRLASDLLAVHDGLQDQIARALAAGRSIPKAAAAIGEALGIVQTYRGRLVAIARTEIQRVANEAALATYTANSDIVYEVEYLATLDSRTCIICAPLHGTTYPLEDPSMPVPPLHPRCRCFLAPVTRSWADLGLGPAQAALFDGRPSGGPSFDQWLKRQPAAVADDVLGPERADAWRAGLALDKFTDRREIIPIDQLRARYPAAF